jgi:hypothetical protein
MKSNSTTERTVNMALNEMMEWSDVGMIETNVVNGVVLGRVREAFKHYQAEKKLIPKGTRLYKFNTYRSLAKSDAWDQTVSPWWSRYFPFEHDPGWAEKKRLAKNMSVNVREWGRLTSAVREDWNSLEWLLIVTFKADVCGWFGGFSQMPRIGESQSMKKSVKVHLVRLCLGEGCSSTSPICSLRT